MEPGMKMQTTPTEPPPQMYPSVDEGKARPGCEPCKAAKEAAVEQAKVESKKALGIVSYLSAKAGKLVSEQVQKIRLAICHTCQETEAGTTVRLFRKIDEKDYCGTPRLADLRKIYRDETEIGCGCNLEDKSRYDAAQCPRKLWGPGALTGKQFKVQVQQTRILKDVLDVQVHYAIKPGDEADMTGIGDTLSALPIVHAVARKWPNKHVRIRVVPGRVEWAKLGWSDVVSSEDWSTNGEWFIRLFVNRLIDIDETWARHPAHTSLYTRHHVMCDAAGVEEPIRDIGLSPSKEAAEWAAGQFGVPTQKGQPIVCLSPFSTSTPRNWPLHHWVVLAEKLTAEGCFVYVVDHIPDRTKFIPFLRYWGWGPDHLCALLKRTNLIIGNDSAMAHFGGVLRRPTIALCSASPGKVVFGWYDTVRVIQTKSACSQCNYIAHKGFTYACDSGCEAMWDLKPSVVLGNALEILKGAKP
jgi:ADP-heptose:LPS heptosyltransferase